MKNSLSILLILAAALPAFADVVPMSRAKANAEQFLKQANPARTPQLQLLFEEPRLTKSGPADPEYFIFTDARGGFVIAGGDEAVPSILGYSTSSAIPAQGMPGNFKAWLDMWTRIVDDARLNGAAPSQEAHPARRGNSPRVLETALWNQGDPFNLHCVEMGDGKRAVTGCTATATAIVMRYHKWPEKGTGSLPGYYVTDKDTGKSYYVEDVELGRVYDWDLMPITKYDGSWSNEQKDAIAWLMNDIGVMLQSSYSPSGTAAYVEDIGPGLIEHFNYDASLQVAYKDYYDTNEWIALLEDNIDHSRPVIYGGQAEDGSGGHAFVISGYDESDRFYINWGWGGNGNGYFVMPNFDVYTQSHNIVTGLKKAAGGTAPDILYLFNLGLSSPSTSFSTGVPFTVSCKSIGNYGETDFVGELAVAKYDRNDQLEEIISGIGSGTITRGYSIAMNDWDCVISTPIHPGDYIAAVYRSTNTPSWTQVRYNHESMVVGRLPVGDTVFLDEIVSLEYNSSTGILTVSFSETASCELRKGAVTVTTGVTDEGNKVTIDAKQLAQATYTLHLQRGDQTKDISLKFGLK